MPFFPSCQLPWDTNSPLQRRVEVGGKNMRHSQTFFNELRRMHLEIELHYSQMQSLKTTTKILKRFNPNKFAEFSGKILFPNVLHSRVFFFLLKESYIPTNWIINASLWIKKKKTFKITALQDCAVTVPSGTWHLTEFCFRTTRKS